MQRPNRGVPHPNGSVLCDVRVGSKTADGAEEGLVEALLAAPPFAPFEGWELDTRNLLLGGHGFSHADPPANSGLRADGARAVPCCTQSACDLTPIVPCSNNKRYIIVHYGATTMVKAVINSRSGAVITVEGTEKEVSGVLAALEQNAAVGHAKEAIAKSQAVKRDQKKRAAASDLVIGLKEDGFFNKPKGLTEIGKALEEKGFIYPVTTLSGVVLGLVQKRLLGRKRADGKWVYGK